MVNVYNRVQGRSLERLAALSAVDLLAEYSCAVRSARQHLQTGCDRAVDVWRGCGVVHHQHVGEHCRNRIGAVELCACTEALAKITSSLPGQ